MKQRHIINAVDEDYYTVKAVFDNGLGDEADPLRYPTSRKNLKQYTFKVHKDQATGFAPEDRALVITRGELQVVIIVKVDEEPDIDWDADWDYKWIVQKVDFEMYHSLLSRDATFKKKLEKVEVANKREQVLAAFGLTGADLKPLLELKQ